MPHSLLFDLLGSRALPPEDRHEPKKISGNFVGEALQERFFYDLLPTEDEKQQLKAKLSKTEFNYHQSAYELYMTEADFVTDMQIVKEVFLEPMEKQFSKHVSKSIFTENFVHLLKVHQALQTAIWNLRDGPFVKDGLGDLFLKQVTF